MANTWGRRATGQGDIKLEEDVLFKEIGGQLDASNFDYSEWQRTDKGIRKNSMKPPAVPKKKPHSTARQWTTKPAAKLPQFVVGQPRSSSAGSHHRKMIRKSDIIQKEAEERMREDRLKVLQLRIMARNRTLEEYRKRKDQLTEENLKLKQTIQENENNAHEKVKDLLTKYEKFTGGISTLSERFTHQHAAAKEELTDMKKQLEAQLKELKTELSAVEKKVAKEQDHLHILLNYKDKEYPVKALRIADLQRELSQLDVTQEEEAKDLKHVVTMELDKFVKEQNYNQRFIMEKVTQETIQMMPPMLKQMAMHNLVMEKEINLHKEEIETLEASNTQLEKEVKDLVRNPKTSIRQQMFPEFYQKDGPCTPDMDVVLDIPTHEWLPL